MQWERATLAITILVSACPNIAFSQPGGERELPRDIGSILGGRGLSGRLLLEPNSADPPNPVAKVPLTLPDVEAEKYELLLAEAGDWEMDSVSSKIRDGKLSLPLNEAVILRPKGAQVANATLGRDYFAGSILQVTRRGTTGASLNRWDLFLRALRNPLTWSASDGAYASTLVAGIERISDDGESVPLPHRVTVRFFTQGAGVRVEPHEIVIERSGAEGYKESELFCQTHTATPTVTAKADLGEKRWEFGVSPQLAKLELTVTKPRLLGLGLETTDLVVRQFAEDGEPLTGSRREVNLKGDRGIFPSTVTLPPDAAQAKATLRSSGIGTASLSAASGAASSESVTVQFEWPWILIGLCVVGGIVGGAVRAAVRLRAGKDPWFVVQAMVGLVAGVVVTGAAATGLVTYGFPTPAVLTEAGGFVVAIVAGYAGNSTLAALARTLGLGGKDSDGSGDAT